MKSHPDRGNIEAFAAHVQRIGGPRREDESIDDYMTRLDLAGFVVSVGAAENREAWFARVQAGVREAQARAVALPHGDPLLSDDDQETALLAAHDEALVALLSSPNADRDRLSWGIAQAYANARDDGARPLAPCVIEALLSNPLLPVLLLEDPRLSWLHEDVRAALADTPALVERWPSLAQNSKTPGEPGVLRALG